MKKEIEDFIKKLKTENGNRTEAMQRPGTSEENYKFYVHTYNNSLDIIKRLDTIVSHN